MPKIHLVQFNIQFHLCLMSNLQQQKGILKNKLLRYKDILYLYNEKVYWSKNTLSFIAS